MSVLQIEMQLHFAERKAMVYRVLKLRSFSETPFPGFLHFITRLNIRKVFTVKSILACIAVFPDKAFGNKLPDEFNIRFGTKIGQIADP